MKYLVFLLFPVFCFAQDSTKVNNEHYSRLMKEHRAYRNFIIEPLIRENPESNIANLFIEYKRINEESEKLKTMLNHMREMGLGLESCKTLAQVDSVMNIYGLRRKDVINDNNGTGQVQAPKSN